MDYRAIPKRFMDRLEPTPDGCLIWPGATAGGSPEYQYAIVAFEGRQVLLHRLVYELAVGPIPPGQHVHHECETTLCCNPNHLKPLPVKEHIGQWHRDKTHCPHGHPYDEANTLIKRSGARHCRACSREQARAKRERENPDRLPPNAERTHCPAGHPYDEENTLVNPSGSRVCRECSRQRVRARRAAAKARSQL